MQLQQGDVTIEAVDFIPDGCHQKKDNHLAEGEITGHFHELTGEGVSVMEREVKNKEGLILYELFAHAPNGGVVTHQEHKPVTVPPGDYKIDRINEWDSFAEQARKVAD